MSSRKYNLLMCDSIERFRFMERLACGLGKSSALVVTGEPLVALKCIRKNIKFHFISSWGRHKKTESVPREFYDSIEFLNGAISKKQCDKDALSSLLTFRYLFKKYSISCAVIWNGQQLLARSIAYVAKENGVKTVFLELSNFNNKLFANHLGVNANSSIAKNVESLDKLEDVSEQLHLKWVEQYQIDKERPLPQARINRKNQIESILNRTFKFLLKGNGLRTFSIKELLNKSQKVSDYFLFDDAHLEKPFAFLPLQVSSDTQLKLHSDFDNCQAIEEAVKVAKAKNLELLVKLHPAEQDQSEIKKIIELREKFNFKVVNENTVHLIKSARLVITINSTVGLEALILSKDLIVLGRALYREFNQPLLRKYIHGYLVDGVDFFDGSVITNEKAQEILSYANK
ncbi:hypothetical protein P4S60_01025 [Pseudoalteromonas sp. Hal040]|uniref:capsular polysaccharide export protein, LipB/KpsS family n=2 Tax=unclassified Pseudoalteromonas TaxID=194690 RepID=UPI00301DC69C